MDNIEENDPLSNREGMMFAKNQDEDSIHLLKQYNPNPHQRSGTTEDSEADDERREEYEQIEPKVDEFEAFENPQQQF